MRRRWARYSAILAACMIPAGSAAAQTRFAWSPPALQVAPGRFDPALMLVASAAVPGAGQYLMDRERWVPYLVVELWGWLTYLDRRGDGRGAEQRYKDLAWSVARRISVGERRDTAFNYYESMAKYETSGDFDSDPQSDGVQPEVDGTTYNGSIWHLARSIFIPSGGNLPPGTVEYQQALAYYERNAIPPAYAWAWGGSQLEQEVYAELIRESDDGYRGATLVLGAIVANHIVSAIDALVAARLGSAVGESQFRLGSGLERAGGGLRWLARARITW
ncbi:MAG: hypothetical protein ACREL7_00290 [Longimicrobiales bacterium]